MQKNNNLKHEIMKPKTIITVIFAALHPVTACDAQPVKKLFS